MHTIYAFINLHLNCGNDENKQKRGREEQYLRNYKKVVPSYRFKVFIFKMHILEEVNANEIFCQSWFILAVFYCGKRDGGVKNRFFKHDESFVARHFKINLEPDILSIRILFRSDRLNQCDLIGRFIALWATVQSLWQQLICPNLLQC